MVDGVYYVDYRGVAGAGNATLVFLNGKVYGCDVTGNAVVGDYVNNSGVVNGDLIMKVGAGVELVTGAPVSNKPYDMPIKFSSNLPKADSQSSPCKVSLSNGQIVASITKITAISA